MKNFSILIFLSTVIFCQAQSLPFDFEDSIVTSDFIDFDGGTATVIANPQPSGINTSATVAQIVRDGGTIWSGSKVPLAENLDFSTMNSITMKVYSTAPVGTIYKLKLEGGGNPVERDMPSTISGEWEEITWDFTGTPAELNDVVFMFDFGNVGDGSINSTFLFDDVSQLFGGLQLDWPVDFEGSNINYTVTDFGGNSSTLVVDPTNENNHAIQSIKTISAATWAGTTIGTNGGFATDIPLTLDNALMFVSVWSPQAGIPVRLKVEDSDDPTHTCETETFTTVANEWEVLEFDFNNEAMGTAALSFGLANGWTYNMASIFFNFGVEGIAQGEQTYYFDNVSVGQVLSSIEEPSEIQLDVFPNPAYTQWQISAPYSVISSIIIFDLHGKQVATIQPMQSSATVLADGLNAGVYIAVITTENNVNYMKLIKE